MLDFFCHPYADHGIYTCASGAGTEGGTRVATFVNGGVLPASQAGKESGTHSGTFVLFEDQSISAVMSTCVGAIIIASNIGV